MIVNENVNTYPTMHLSCSYHKLILLTWDLEQIRGVISEKEKNKMQENVLSCHRKNIHLSQTI